MAYSAYLLSSMIGSRFWGAGGRITPLWGLSPAAPGGLWRGTFEGFGGGGGGGGGRGAWRYSGFWLQPGEGGREWQLHQ